MLANEGAIEAYLDFLGDSESEEGPDVVVNDSNYDILCQFVLQITCLVNIVSQVTGFETISDDLKHTLNYAVNCKSLYELQKEKYGGYEK